MVAVVTTVNDSGIREGWTTPGGEPSAYLSAVPLASIIYFSDGVTINAKDAADEMTITVNLTLPQNYFYRLAFLEMGLRFPLLADLEDYEKAARVQVFENALSQYRFPLHNQIEFATAGAEPGFKSDPDAITDDFSTHFERTPGLLQTELIDASGAGATLVVITLVDTSSDATSAGILAYRMRVWQYTSQQANLSGVHTPTLII